MSFSRMLRKFLEKNTQWTPSTEESLIRGVAALSQYNIITGDYEGAEEVVEVLSRWWIVAKIKEGPLPAHVVFDRGEEDAEYEGGGWFRRQGEGEWPIVPVDAESVLKVFKIEMAEVYNRASAVAQDRSVEDAYLLGYEPTRSWVVEVAIGQLLRESGRVHAHLAGGAYEPSLEEKTEDEDEELELSLTSHMVAKLKS